ncbi:MAG: TonB-dependent receptor [Rubrivivax sp.]
MAKKVKIQPSTVVRAIAVAFGGLALLPVAQAQQSGAQGDQRIEITGSRLKRVDSEGALPVTVIDRQAIEASGQNSVAELMRSITFSSFGNTKPQSGNSAQALADVDLRGLGSNRTLVLIDGRRISKAPFSGQSQDLNQIPLAAVDRIEILTDGASAIYGSDAIGGVVNVITRKNFNGLQFSFGQSNPEVTGGDTQEFSVLLGTSGTKGQILAGASANSRGMIYTRDQIGGGSLGISSYGNNYRRISNTTKAPTGSFVPVPGFDCTKNNFWETAPGTASNTCSFNFNAIAANEASVGNKSVFTRGEYNVNDNWQFYTNAMVSNLDSFGRYAPTPVQVTLAPTSPAYLSITGATPGLAAASPLGLSLRHRMAAAGARDTSSDATVTTLLVGTKARLFGSVDVDAGVRWEKYKYLELGRGYIVRPLLESAITSGAYDIFKPFANSPDVLNSVKATISRDDIWDQKEVYASASAELFKIAGATVTGVIGFESRKEKFQDNYDPLSEAGVIEGSAGNSSAGSRQVDSAFFELALPFSKDLEFSLAGRQDSYTKGPGGNGKSFSPKVSGKWRPIKNLALRASYGEGFRAPTLDALTQKPSFSADSIADFRTCRAYGGTSLQCGDTNGDGVQDANQLVSIQVDATVIANPSLQPETSKQSSFGLVYDATDWLSATLDVYQIKINGRITAMSAQTIINRTANPALGPVPAAFSIARDPATGAIMNITRGSVNEGTVDVSGYDMSVKTDFKLGAWGRLKNTLQVSVLEKYSLNGGINLVGYQENPKFRASLSNNWEYGRFSTTLAINHIDKQKDVDVKAYTTADLSVSYTHPTKTRLTVGVVNLEGRMPELITSNDGRPWNFNLYDALGRQVYFRVSQAF